MVSEHFEERLVTLDYSMEGHDLIIVVDGKLHIREMHFRTGQPLGPVEMFEFLTRTFNANRSTIQAKLDEVLR